MMTLRAVAERGEEIYRERYKADYEKQIPGSFVAIAIEDGRVFVADSPEKALQTALDTLPDGVFHLLKVGAPAVFRVASSRCGVNSGEWILRKD